MKQAHGEFDFLFVPTPTKKGSQVNRMGIHQYGSYLEEGLVTEDFQMLIEEELPTLADMDLDDPDMEELYNLVQLGWARSFVNHAASRFDSKVAKKLLNDENLFRKMVTAKLSNLMARQRTNPS